MSAKTIQYKYQDFLDQLGEAVALNDFIAIRTQSSSVRLVVFASDRGNTNFAIKTVVAENNTDALEEAGFKSSANQKVFASERFTRWDDIMVYLGFNDGATLVMPLAHISGDYGVSDYGGHDGGSVTSLNALHTRVDVLLSRVDSRYWGTLPHATGYTPYITSVSKFLIALSWATKHATLSLVSQLMPISDETSTTTFLVSGTTSSDTLDVSPDIITTMITVEFSRPENPRLQSVYPYKAHYIDIRFDDVSSSSTLDIAGPMFADSGQTYYKIFHLPYADFLAALEEEFVPITVLANRRLLSHFRDSSITMLLQMSNTKPTYSDFISAANLCRYHASYRLRNKFAMIADIQPYLSMGFSIIDNQWYPNFSLESINGDVFFNRSAIRNDFSEYAFYSCEYCGSRTYADDSSFIDSIENVESELYERLRSIYDVSDVEDILTQLSDWIQNDMSEEDPENNEYCRDCGLGEHHSGEYFESLSPHTAQEIGNRIAHLNKKVVSGSSYGQTIYYVTDTNEPKTINVAGFMDEYGVNEYDYDPSVDFIVSKRESAETNKDHRLYLGLEWEMDHGGTNGANSFMINSALSKNKSYSWTMKDGSLESGIEIATMPATLEAHMTEFDYDTACVVASSLDYRGHDCSSAGIHVHMSRKFFGRDSKIQMYKGALMALVLERNWDDFVRFSRRRYNRLDQWAKKKDMIQNLPVSPTPEDYEKTFKDRYGYDKYVALNTNKDSTFELRIFKSTLKADTIKATLQLVNNLASWVKANDLAAAQTVTMDDIINYQQHKELTEYWQEAKERTVRD